jgi:hypothetical protein
VAVAMVMRVVKHCDHEAISVLESGLVSQGPQRITKIKGHKDHKDPWCSS